MNRPKTKFAVLGFASIAVTVLAVSATALSAPQTPRAPIVLENEFLSISVDAQTGAIVDCDSRDILAGFKP